MRTIAVIGGTGNLGLGLAQRWALAGCEVTVGSRDAARAQEAAAMIAGLAAARGTATRVTGASNEEAASRGEIVALTVPFGNQITTLESIRAELDGKILIDTTVPLLPPAVARVQLPPEGSAGLRAQALLGERVRVVSAFQNVAAHHLRSDAALDCDVLVTGNDKSARDVVVDLARLAGMRGIHAGSLANSVAAEALTSLLIFVNKTYKCHSGVRLTGLAEDAH